MKKVLIVYYKQKSIMSVIRLGGLIKYLPEFGWEPIILTNEKSPELRDYNVITVPFDDDVYYKKNEPKIFKNVNKNSNIIIRITRHIWYLWYVKFFLYPDKHKDWYEPALQAVEKFLKTENIDAVISSYPSVTPHLIAETLKEKHGINWIADMRDLWTQYSYYQHKNFFPRKYIERRLESRTLSKADSITIVSKPLAVKLKKLHANSNIFIIPNGFDPDLLHFNMNLTKKFTITHAGQILNGKKDPSILFEAIIQLKSENKIDLEDFQINFYGTIYDFDFDFLEKSAKKYSLEEVVQIHGMINREEVLKKEFESQLLLLIRGNNSDEVGVYSGKIFEYLAAERPILSIGSTGGVVEELLIKTNAGVNLNKLNEIKNHIEKTYLEYKNNGRVKYEGIPEQVNKYSHKNMAKKFATLLNEITNSS